MPSIISKPGVAADALPSGSMQNVSSQQDNKTGRASPQQHDREDELEHCCHVAKYPPADNQYLQ
jgi:hypothetical protein